VTGLCADGAAGHMLENPQQMCFDGGGIGPFPPHTTPDLLSGSDEQKRPNGLGFRSAAYFVTVCLDAALFALGLDQAFAGQERIYLARENFFHIRLVDRMGGLDGALFADEHRVRNTSHVVIPSDP